MNEKNPLETTADILNDLKLAASLGNPNDATEYARRLTHLKDPTLVRLRKRVAGAVSLQVNVLHIDTTDQRKDRMARQLQDGNAVDRILQHLATDPAILGHDTMTDEQIIAMVLAVIEAHYDTGFYQQPRG